MGRTGRKREGRVVFLLTEGKEERDHLKSQDSYEKIQKKIASGNDFRFDLDNSPRILPREIQPDCIKKEIIPPNETMDALELKVDRRKKVPKRERDWTLPENAETGFVKASSLQRRKRKRANEEETEGFMDPDLFVSPFLSKEEEARVRKRRVHVSPTPRRMDISDTNTVGFIPAGSLRDRLVRTRQAMKDPSRSTRIYTIDDDDHLTSTPPALIASPCLSERDVNVSLDGQRKRLFEGLEDELSSADDLPELSTVLFNGRDQHKTNSSDDSQ